MAKVKLKLVQEEAQTVANGEAGTVAVHESSASTFLLTGLELEDLQCVVVVPQLCLLLTNSRRSMLSSIKKAKQSGLLRTDNQLTKLQERRTALQRKLIRFRELQHTPELCTPFSFFTGLCYP